MIYKLERSWEENDPKDKPFKRWLYDNDIILYGTYDDALIKLELMSDRLAGDVKAHTIIDKLNTYPGEKGSVYWFTRTFDMFDTTPSNNPHIDDKRLGTTHKYRISIIPIEINKIK